MMKELDKVCALGGEGIMIKDPKSPYENKRSNYLLKVKNSMMPKLQSSGMKKAQAAVLECLVH